MMNSRQLAALNNMGIDVWVRRPAAGAAGATENVAPAAAGERVAGRPDAPVAVLAVWHGELRLDRAHAGGALLLKVLAALKAPMDRFVVLRLAQVGEAAAALAAHVQGSPQHVLVFADAPADLGDCVQLPSLERMLRDEGAKRPAWAALKPLVGALGPP